MAITGGVNWIDLLPPLNNVHWIWTLLMLFYIAFAAEMQDLRSSLGDLRPTLRFSTWRLVV